MARLPGQPDPDGSRSNGIAGNFSRAGAVYTIAVTPLGYYRQIAV